jgi:hypothetical protein
MSAITIGIQTIMPKTGTSPKDTPPQPASARDDDRASSARRQAPPPPGLGKFVDKTA